MGRVSNKKDPHFRVSLSFLAVGMTRFELATTGPPDLDSYVVIFVYLLDLVYLCTDNQSFNKQSK